jgi:alkylhydroperoxidase family enzyme
VPRVSVPADRDPMMYVWGELAKGLTRPAAAFSEAVYHESILPLREFEAARVRIAQINDCNICLNWRTARDVAGRSEDPNEVPEEFYANIGANPEWSGFSPRERLSAEFAGRFALDHLGMDDAFWAQLHEHFSDTELVDLALCVGSWVAFGRLNRIFDIDGACRIPVGAVQVSSASA